MGTCVVSRRGCVRGFRLARARAHFVLLSGLWLPEAFDRGSSSRQRGSNKPCTLLTCGLLPSGGPMSPVGAFRTYTLDAWAPALIAVGRLLTPCWLRIPRGPATGPSRTTPSVAHERLREHLQVLRSIIDTGEVDFHGTEFTAAPEWPVALPGGMPLPVYVAAMGPKALRVAGELADGTLPYLAGPRTVAEFIVPTITKAAADAGRPAPRVIAAVPVLMTDEVDAGRAAAADTLGFYATIPSYQKVIAREGVESVAELAAVGPADVVRTQLQRYRDAGATDLVLSPLRGVEGDRQRLWEVAASL
ncbi:MAG TPA: TIGR03564 family F420-dependent LLM class oxidoreductase [Mycobacterium sp.]|nr:TIGR03564 family F420-dependent LLM class oxidoreductase [Mycobacterium sp.]